MQIARRLRMIEIMNFCEKNRYAYNITWHPMHVYEVQFMWREHQYAAEDFLAKLDEQERDQ